MHSSDLESFDKNAAFDTIVDPVVPRSPPLPLGAIVAERYRVERFIDEGGMAQVFEATNLELDERVALKLAHPIYRSSQELVARFRAEARALARVRSEHVARVFDVVSTDTGDPVMVMELLEGENLARIIEKKALPAQEQLVGWMIEACSGLGVAHANGIVHRDVKPGNIYIADVLGGRRTVKVLDFGISRLALTTAREQPIPTTIAELKLFGTPMYMAPEQILSSKAADPRIDVWSIGVVLFELLAGEPPFAADKVEDLCAKIIEGKAPSILSRRPDLDPDLADVVQRCLRRNPEERFPSVADLAVALLPFAPPYHVSSVDQTVSVLKAAGLTTVDVPAIISLRAPTTGNGARVDTLASGLRPSSQAPGSMGSMGSIAPSSVRASSPAPAETDSQRNMPSRGNRWVGPVMVAAFIAVLVGVGLFVRRPAPPAMVTAAAPVPVEMRFDTDPSGAMLEVDGAAVGMSPTSAILVPGRHVLTINKPGFERLSTIVDVSSQVPSQVTRFPLTPLPAAANPALDAPAKPSPKAPEERAAAPRDRRPAAAAAAPAAVEKPSAAAAQPPPRPTVKVIDDSPSTTRVIQ